MKDNPVPSSVLVTGASGFVGRALCSVLLSRQARVRAVVRKNGTSVSATEHVWLNDINGETDWKQALEGVECIVHLAARVHVTQDTALDPLAEFRKTNVLGSLCLARQALAAGVKRFVHVSSIHADPLLGKKTPYALSKQEAEAELLSLVANTPMKLVIIRPPPIYGPGVKARMLSLLSLCVKNIPLPFASLTHRRDMISLDNLVDIIVQCLGSATISGNVYAVRDAQSLSVAEMITLIRKSMGMSPNLFPCPFPILLALATLSGRKNQFLSLMESIIIDDLPLRTDLGWLPQTNVEQDIKKMTDWFLATRVRGTT